MRQHGAAICAVLLSFDRDGIMMASKWRAVATAFSFALGTSTAAVSDSPWQNAALSADTRAALLAHAMTLEEKIALLHAHAPLAMANRPSEIGPISGFVAGNARLAIPALRATDGGLGVTSPSLGNPNEGAMVLPSGIAQAATWDSRLAYAGGAVIGDEAHRKGFNIVLAGALNLARDPRCGRNFEYAGEDPLLSGIIVGEEIRGIQDQHVISTTKHFALNDQETGRALLNARIDPASLRESDLLAFEIAIEHGQPGAVMCSYNSINGSPACENDFLLNGALKRDWRYPGWVLSDWGATHSTVAAVHAGLDQEAGEEFDGRSYFDKPLHDAVVTGGVSHERLDSMVRHILRSLFIHGVMDHPAREQPIDYEADAAVAEHVESEAIVLLKNDEGLLPLPPAIKKIAVIGGHADTGVLGGGGGSSEVMPHGGPALRLRGTQGDWPVFQSYIGSSPLRNLKAAFPDAAVAFDNGNDTGAAAALAAASDVAIVFATQWTTESADTPDLSLPDKQDALIAAIAAANRRTIIVLETGGPVRMPWVDNVPAIIEAWYSGSRGAEAIVNVLTGATNPSGRLPITFPASEDQLPRPVVDSAVPRAPFDVDYIEGANVGYRWFETRDMTPLFPFGFGLSYTQFQYSHLSLQGGKTLTAAFDITNRGSRAGAETAEVYAAQELSGGQGITHLVGWTKVALQPGETRHVAVTADRRLLGHFDPALRRWIIPSSHYFVSVGRFAGDAELRGIASMHEVRLVP